MASNNGHLIGRFPRELQLNICELSTWDSRQSIFALALACKTLNSVTSYILYHSIFVSNERQLKGLSRTASTPSGLRRLTNHVENLTFSHRLPTYPGVQEDVARIIGGCRNLRTLGIPEKLVPALSRTVLQDERPMPLKLIVGGMPAVEKWNLNGIRGLMRRVSHLDFAQPPERWVDPCSLLSALPLAPGQMNHLTLARKEHANEDNDQIFMECVSDILFDNPPDAFSGVLSITIRIFPAYGSGRHDEDAAIWNEARQLADRDRRVSVEKGFWNSYR